MIDLANAASGLALELRLAAESEALFSVVPRPCQLCFSVASFQHQLLEIYLPLAFDSYRILLPGF
jgi:hypothetical protein